MMVGSMSVVLLLTFSFSFVGAETAVSVAGVQKVIQMLNDMSASRSNKKNDEEIAFAKFTTWCSQETSSLKKEINTNSADIESLDAEIAKLTHDVQVLGKEIGELSDNVVKFKAEVKSETAQRERDHAAFLVEEQDYSESVDALDRAIAVMQKQDYDRPALLQLVEMERLPERAQSLVSAFLSATDANSTDKMSYAAPEANAYEFQSGGIVELLKKLMAEFTEKLGTCQKEEMNSKHAYDMVVEDLTDAIENSEKEIDDKTVLKEQKSSSAAENKKQLAATEAEKVENEATLKATETECAEKKLSFAEKQKLRTEEIEAIAKAIEIMSSPEVSGNAEKYLDLSQRRQTGTALVQMDDGSQGIRLRIKEFLVTEGQRLKSQQLALLAQKIAADPFAKVKKLIDDMITRLLEEAREDAEHEGFCDKEMGKSKITRAKLNEDIDRLTAAMEEGEASIAKLAETIAQLTKEVEELITSMGEATALRTAEKEKNAVTVEDAKSAQTAVEAATAVLKDFYEKASTATALLQAPNPRQWGLKQGVKMGTDEWNALADPNFKGTVDTGHKDGMQTFGKTYEGQQDENEYGVLGLLEVIHSDFASLQADTEAAEAEAQKLYEDFMTESKRNKAVKEKNIKMSTADKATATSKLQEDTADLKSTQDELLAAERYYKKLVPQCIDQGMTWDERVKAREEEIASLKQALSILSSPDIATSA